MELAGGANIAFSVGAGALTTFSYVLSTHVLTVTTAARLQRRSDHVEGAVADRGTWWPWTCPAAASTWHFRLHWSQDGGLGLDAEAVTGGDSIPLTLDPHGPVRAS